MARIKKYLFTFLEFGLLVLAFSACSLPTQVKPTATQTLAFGTTMTQPIQTQEATEAAKLLTPQITLPPASPTPTSTLPGTASIQPSPYFSQTISADNAEQVIQLTRWGKGSPSQLVYSADGRQFALFTSLGVYLYDAQNLSQLRFFPAKPPASLAAISPDWKTLASIGENKLRLLNTSDGSPIQTFQTDQGTVAGAQFSPDGSLVALEIRPPGEEVYHYLVEIRQVSDGALLGSWDLQGMDMVFSPDGKSLAAWYAMTGIQLWSVPDGRPLLNLKDPNNPVQVAFSPDGSSFASMEMDGSLQFYRSTDGAPLSKLQVNGSHFAFSPDGTLVAVSSADGKAQLWRVADGSLVRALDIGQAGSGLLAFSPDQSTLALGSGEGISFWSVSDGSLRRALDGHMGAVQQACFSENGQAVAMLVQNSPGGNKATFQLHKLSGKSPDYSIDGIEAVSLACSTDGARLALGLWNGDIQLRQAEDGKLQNTLKGHTAQVQSVDFSPDGRLLASSSMEEIRIWQSGDGTLTKAIQVPGGWVAPIQFAPDGKSLASFSADGSLRLWQIPDGKLVNTLQSAENGWEGSLAFAPDGVPSGGMLALSAHLKITIWRTADGQLLQTLQLGAPAASGLSYSPDGFLLAAGLSDGSIQLWETSSGKVLQTLTGHTAGISSLEFSPDGAYLISGSVDGTLRVWGLSGAQ
jgi:WD40 repeat protein